MDLQVPAAWLVETVRSVLDGSLAAPLDQAEALWRSVLPAGAVHVVDEFVATSGSVHAARLPLMNPFDVATIIVVYLTVVLLGLVSPLPKLEAKPVVLLHNLVLVVLSGYMVTEVLRQASLGEYSLWGNPADESARGWPMARIIWVFYVSKILEFNDTVRSPPAQAAQAAVPSPLARA
jgi:hypothetical protein